MENSFLYVQVDGEILDTNSIYSAEFSSDIYNIVDKGTLILKDTTGAIFSNFKFLIGTQVDIQIVGKSVDGSDIDTKINLPSLFIKSFNDDLSLNMASNAGFITLKLTSRWTLYQDFTDHAYAPNCISKIMKTILEDSTRGFSLTIDTDRFGTSSDSGSVPRYKCGIGDLDYMEKYLKPICCIEESPTYMFSRAGKICLQSFSNLYSKKASVLIIPNTKVANSLTEKIKNYATSVGAESLLFAAKMLPSVGEDKDGNMVYTSLYPDIYLFDDMLHVNQVIQTKPSIKITKKTGTKSGNAIPVNKYLSLGIVGTDTRLYNMRFIEDIKSLSFNRNENLSQMFQTRIACSFCGDMLEDGDTVELYAPPYQDTSGKKVTDKQHWLTGKWLVSEIVHAVEKGHVDMVTSVLTLIRPTFTLDESKTSVTTLPYMARIS